MNIIFLDVDGVLNYKEFEDLYFYDFLINSCSEHIDVDERNVEILSYICKETNSKVVLSSSWKLMIKEDGTYNKNLTELLELFKKYNIDFYGFTPNIPNIGVKHGKRMWKEYDIIEYLKQHKEVKSFCIIDDQTYDLESLKEYLVLTSYDSYGIRKEHLEETKRILELTRYKINNNMEIRK